MKFIRKCLGYTQREVAKKLNVERSMYTYYEIGKMETGVLMYHFQNLETYLAQYLTQVLYQTMYPMK